MRLSNEYKAIRYNKFSFEFVLKKKRKDSCAFKRDLLRLFVLDEKQMA